MTEENKEKIELIPAEKNPWYDFMKATIALDYKHDKNYGWHWFWGLYFIKGKLPDFDLTKIKDILSSEHWLKEAQVPNPSKELDNLTQDLLKAHEDQMKIEKIDFSGLSFEDTCDFSNFIFPINTFFERVKFCETKFNDTVFFNVAIFNNVEFCSRASFEMTLFCKSVDFVSVIFLDDASFFAAEFTTSVSFSETRFAGLAYFSNVEFLGFTTSFDNTKFSSNTIFNNTKFCNNTSFNNAKFSSYTTFENAIFERHAPKFYGAELNDEMFWTDIKLPKFEKMDDEAEDSYKKRIKDNENAYENLSTKLGNQKKYRDEHFFFRQEMSCQRELAESYTSGIAFWLYGTFSDYGYRIGRAFWCWLGHIALGALVIAFIAMCGGMRFHESLPCAIPVSFANANPYVFFGFESSSLKECYKILEPLAPISFAIIKAIQTVLGIALLFLVVLTLRVRFRLK